MHLLASVTAAGLLAISVLPTAYAKEKSTCHKIPKPYDGVCDPNAIRRLINSADASYMSTIYENTINQPDQANQISSHTFDVRGNNADQTTPCAEVACSKESMVIACNDKPGSITLTIGDVFDVARVLLDTCDRNSYGQMFGKSE